MNEQYKSKYLKYKNKYYNFIINKKLTGGNDFWRNIINIHYTSYYYAAIQLCLI